MTDSRRKKSKPQPLGSLIPEAARALGLQAEFEFAQRAQVFHETLLQIAPHLAPHCRLVGESAGGRLSVEVDDRATAQELHLRSTEIAHAYSVRPGGARAIGLNVRLGPGDVGPERH